jgi:DNA-binding NtrC family response regulator
METMTSRPADSYIAVVWSGNRYLETPEAHILEGDLGFAEVLQPYLARYYKTAEADVELDGELRRATVFTPLDGLDVSYVAVDEKRIPLVSNFDRAGFIEASVEQSSLSDEPQWIDLWSRWARSEKRKAAWSFARRVALMNVPVLIQGEVGVGKTALARAIVAASPRHDRPLVSVSCSSIPEELIEEELFGAGAGSGRVRRGLVEIADTGTLLLEEINALPLRVQAKLLVLIESGRWGSQGESRSVDVRIIATAQRPLEHEIEKGLFREDLYYRLAVATIHIPPLRESREDIPVLLDHFANVLKAKYHRNFDFGDPARELLLAYSWPGNLRELETIAERFLVVEDQSLELLRERVSELRHHGEAKFTQTLEAVEREAIARALLQTHYNREEAARLLGVSLRTLRRKLAAFREEFGGRTQETR